VTRRKRQPSAAVRRAVAVERRAAEIAASWLRGENDRSDAESRGWVMHYYGPFGYCEHLAGPPRGPAELAGWLAREIWSAS
jgi:hypothetical protein